MLLLSKGILSALVVLYGVVTLRPTLGNASLSHAAAFAMAASHSFDVTLGVPLAKELYPSAVAYVYLNQSIQLVAINPQTVVPGHCSGWKATHRIARALPDAYMASNVGTTFSFTSA